MTKSELKQYHKEYYLKNKLKIDEKNRTYNKNNKEKLKNYHKEWYKNNRDNYLIQCKEYGDKNRDKRRNYSKKYSRENKGKIRAKTAKYRATKLQQTPKWADLKAIEEFYKNCPEGYHVDHIIPLQGKNVRGLHVLDNLQYLPAIENFRKNNHF